jgi:hypothetical protein
MGRVVMEGSVEMHMDLIIFNKDMEEMVGTALVEMVMYCMQISVVIQLRTAHLHSISN